MAVNSNNPVFSLSPEARASKLHGLRRLMFHTPPLVTTQDADLANKTAIITGSNTGIGLETARHLLDLGAKVILAVRSDAKGKKAAEDLARGRRLSLDSISVWNLDMSDYQSILNFAEKAKSLQNLDIIVLNAAVLKFTEVFGPHGYEESFHTNYLSTTLLLLLLIPVLREKRTPGGPGRIAITSSDWASWAELNISGSEPILPQFKKSRQPWDGFNAYGIGKLLSQMFVSELVKHLSTSEVIITHPDPAMNKTAFGRELSGMSRVTVKIASALLGRDPPVGARVLVHSVTTIGEAGQGQYVEDETLQPLAPVLYKPEGQRLAKKLFDETLDELSFANVRDLIEGKI